MPRDGEPEPVTDEERRAFRAALAARRERLAYAGRVFALALFGLVAAAVLLRLPDTWWVPAVGFVAVAGLLFRLANWKCPACGERLPTRGGRVCRGCGAPIDE
jgi:fatty acid desaturase